MTDKPHRDDAQAVPLRNEAGMSLRAQDYGIDNNWATDEDDEQYDGYPIPRHRRRMVPREAVAILPDEDGNCVIEIEEPETIDCYAGGLLALPPSLL